MASYEQLELDRQLCFALHRASRAVVRSYGPLLAASGLTYTQYLVLLVLWEESLRPFTVGEIGARLHLDSGTLTPLLKRLEGLGHVRRRRDTADERRVLIGLTDGGLALRDELVDVPSALFSGLGLDLEVASRLHDDLGRLTAQLETLESAPPA
ncbi:MAG: transcriptional regulator, MarR family [Acidimicrobiales bacterium]|nr:transcriptional regulator, MarR family [Acidimicrobiales bacterium]